MKNTIQSAVVILLAAITISCGNTDNPVAQRAHQIRKNRGNIVIAAASSWESNANYLWEGISLACDETNAAGGVLGKKITLIKVDDLHTADGGQKAAYSICENPLVSIVIGHSASNISIPNSLIYQYYGVLMISPLSTNDKLTHQGFTYIFRNIPVDTEIGSAAADFCKRKGWNKLLVYYADTDYGQNLSNSFEMQCSTLALSIADRKSWSDDSLPQEDRDVVNYWKKNFSYDAIFVAGDFPRIGEIVREIHTELPNVPIIGGETLNSHLLFEIAGDKAENVYMTSIFDPNSTDEHFVQFAHSFTAKYNHDPDQSAMQGYDALKLAVYGIQTAKSAEPEKIAAALHTVNNWEGPAGPYTINQNGDITEKKIFIMKTKDGTFIRAE